MENRPAIDTTLLPSWAFDTRTPVWWGNTLMLFIETTTVALMIVSYFYLAKNFEQWPPPRVDKLPANFNPVPDLSAGTLNIVVLGASCLPMLWVDRAARRPDGNKVKFGLLFLGILALVMVGIRVFEFPALKFSWDDNAYGSLVWSLLGLHFMYLGLAAVECLVIAVWLFMYGIDERHAIDVTLTAIYWYWTAGVGLVIYAVVYWAPRIL
jgi:heme/copper-type cytochrome/quinol oxidase subunit 3